MTAKFIEELTPVTALSKTDQIVVEQADGTKRTSVEKVVSGRPIRSRPVPISGKKFVEYTASTTITKAGYLALVRAQPGFENVVAEQVEVEVRTCSGGGGGCWGNSTGYGGMPGVIVDGKTTLDQLPDGDIPVTVGGGARSGNDSGSSQFGSSLGSFYVFSCGVKRGGNNDAEENSFHSFFVGYGLKMGLRVYHLNTAPLIRPSQPLGPGGGGSNKSTGNINGGTSSLSRIASAVEGGLTNGANAPTPAKADDWDSYGAGGAGTTATSGAGGNGSFPGGGGGASRTAAYPGDTVGMGAAGSVRVRFTVKDTIF